MGGSKGVGLERGAVSGGAQLERGAVSGGRG